jgi:hypothetical protein
MKRPGIMRLIASLVLSLCVAYADSDGNRVREDLRYLSSPALAGRGTGTAGLDLAAAYISEQFSKAGVRPLGGQSYLHKFPVSLSSTLGTVNTMAQRAGHQDALPLALGTDFIPLGFSGSGQSSAAVVFAGFGITAPELSYDDYADINATGKIVVILRHEPQEYETASAFEGKVYTEHSQLLTKALNARAHGAEAVLFVNDTAAHSGPDALEKFSTLVGPGDPGLPFVQIKAEIVESWFRSAGRDFKSVQEQIDRSGQPVSFEFGDELRVDLSISVEHQPRQVANVVGFLPGRTDEYLVIGAHYDHLGHGEQYSLAPNTAGTVHPGADDNASGVAGVLALARRFGSQPPRERGVLFIAFAGEELGLLGSSFYLNRPLLPVEKAVAMINMDMIGRLRDKRVIVGGVRTGSGLREAVAAAAAKHSITPDVEEHAVYGSSDHTCFKARKIPVLFFFTGLHADYHRPSDTADKIDAAATVKLLRFIGDVAAALTDGPQRPQFTGAISGPINQVPVSSGASGAPDDAGSR